jgi:hypothetical protein
LYIVISIVISSLLPIMWSFLFLFTGILGLKLYIIKEQRLQQFLPKVKHASVWDNDEPDHWILGYPYIGYIKTNTGDRGCINKTLYLFTSTKFYAEEIIGLRLNQEKKLTFYIRSGNFYNIRWSSRQVPVTQRDARDNQQKAIDSIIKYYKEQKNNVVVLIYGETGSGKSMISSLLGQQLLEQSDSNITGVSFVDTFNPTDPGDTFDTLYAKAHPTPTKPLIVVLEEWDCVMLEIHENTIKIHDDMNTMVKKKGGWNKFLDDFDRGWFPNVFLIMTSNHPDTYIDKMDPSYMREGRVNLRIAV